MSGIYASYPATSAGGTEIPQYPTMGDFPNPTSVPNGTFAFALDTDTLYVSDGVTWEVIGGPGVALAIGTFDSGVASADGAHIDSNELIMQSASATVPGLVNTTTQTLAGDKTFTGNISAANLSGTNTGDVTVTAVGSSPNADAASLAGQALTLQPADSTNPGVLTAGTQSIGGDKTFTGNITAVNLSGTNTGDVTLTAVGSSPNADGASLSGQQLTLQPADSTNPGLVSTTTQSFAGYKTILGQLAVQSGVVPSILIGANDASTTITDSTDKFARVAIPHYLSATEEPFNIVSATSQNATSDILIGGGATTLNAATTIRFYTAADTTTLFGTERLTITSSGEVYVHSMTINGPVYTTGGVGSLQSEQYLDRTRGGTGISTTVTFPTSATDNADFVMKGAVNQTIDGNKTFSGATKFSALTTNGPVYTSGGDGAMNSEAQLNRTRGGTGVSSTATFPTSATNDADFVMKGAVNQTIGGVKTFAANSSGGVFPAVISNSGSGTVGLNIVRSGGTASDWEIAAQGASTNLYFAGPSASGLFYLTNAGSFIAGDSNSTGSSYINGGLDSSSSSTDFALRVRNSSAPTTFSGSSGMVLFLRADGTTIGSITRTGANTIVYTASSDERLKKDIVDLAHETATDFVDSVSARSFRWKDDDSLDEGFIAQEIMSYAPRAVVEVTGTLQLDKSALVPYLWQALRDTRSRLAEVEAKLEDINNQ